eukprot:3277551-Pleurochrysis_carterae.AAC.1
MPRAPFFTPPRCTRCMLAEMQAALAYMRQYVKRDLRRLDIPPAQASTQPLLSSPGPARDRRRARRRLAEMRTEQAQNEGTDAKLFGRRRYDPTEVFVAERRSAQPGGTIWPACCTESLNAFGGCLSESRFSGGLEPALRQLRISAAPTFQVVCWSRTRIGYMSNTSRRCLSCGTYISRPLSQRVASASRAHLACSSHVSSLHVVHISRASHSHLTHLQCTALAAAFDETHGRSAREHHVHHLGRRALCHLRDGQELAPGVLVARASERLFSPAGSSPQRDPSNGFHHL